MTQPAQRPPSFLRRHMATSIDSEHALVALACDDSLWVRREAASNPATPRWVLDLLVRAGADEDLRGRGLPDPTMSPADLRRLVECGPWAQQLVAEHPNSASDVLDALVDHPSVRTRSSVARHPRAAPNTIAKLCADPEPEIRQLAAEHPSRPDDEYRLLCSAGSDETLTNLRHDPAVDLDPDVLERLAKLGAWGRFLAARHQRCPIALLEELAGDPDWRVRSGVLDNPAAEIDLVTRVAGLDADESADPLRPLSDPASTGQELSGLANHPRAEVRLAVVRHPGITHQVVGLLAVDRTAEVRRAAATHALMDSDELALLVRAGSSADLARLADPDPETRHQDLEQLSCGGYWAGQLAVRHPATPPSVVSRLLCDEDPKLREWAAVHPHAPADVIADIRRAGGAQDFQGIAEADPEMPEEDLRRVAALGPWGEWIVSWHPNAPAAARRRSAYPSADDQPLATG